VQDIEKNNGAPEGGNEPPAFYRALFSERNGASHSSRRSRSVASFRPIKLVGSAVQSAAYASTRAYGWFLLSFGLVSLFLHLAAYYFSSSPSEELSQLVIGAIFAVLSIPLMIIDMPMCQALQRFPLTDYLLFEFFSIKRLGEDKRRKSPRSIIGMIAGIVPAIFGFFFPMESVVFVLVALLVVTVSFVSPEFPFLLMLMLVPYAGALEYTDELLVAISLLSMCSFFAKVMLGKRHYSIDVSDICIIVFATVILVFGVIGGGHDSTRISMVLVALSLGYIPASNIVVNRRLADCAIDAIIFSSLPISVVAIAQYITALVLGERAPASSLMSSPYILATYLSVAIALVAFSISDARGALKRGIYIAFLPVLNAALIATECLPVLIVLLLMLLARSIVRSRRAHKELLILLAAVPSLLFLLPTSALVGISSLSPMSTTLVELRAEFLKALDSFGHNIIVGDGAADLSGNSSGMLFNTALGLGCRFGIFAVIVLFVVCIIRLRQDTAYSAFLKSSQLFVFSNMTTVAMFAMAACGWFCDVFADLGLYCLFFALFGLNTSALRISRSEHEEREWYFRDQKDVDSSTVDVFLRGQ
jgi:hypothetical protein